MATRIKLAQHDDRADVEANAISYSPTSSARRHYLGGCAQAQRCKCVQTLSGQVRASLSDQMRADRTWTNACRPYLGECVQVYRSRCVQTLSGQMRASSSDHCGLPYLGKCVPAYLGTCAQTAPGRIQADLIWANARRMTQVDVERMRSATMAAISVCENGQEWQLALGLLRTMGRGERKRPPLQSECG